MVVIRGYESQNEHGDEEQAEKYRENYDLERREFFRFNRKSF